MSRYDGELQRLLKTEYSSPEERERVLNDFTERVRKATNRYTFVNGFLCGAAVSMLGLELFEHLSKAGVLEKIAGWIQ